MKYFLIFIQIFFSLLFLKSNEYNLKNILVKDNNKVYMRIKKTNSSTLYIYNYYNLPLSEINSGLAEFIIPYIEISKFYYYENQKLLFNVNKFDEFLFIQRNIQNRYWNNKDNVLGYYFIYKQNSPQIYEFNNEIPVNSNGYNYISNKDEYFKFYENHDEFNAEGYPISLRYGDQSYNNRMLFPSSFFLYNFNYYYEYNENLLTYDGKKQIKKITETRRINSNNILNKVNYNIFYDDIGRINKISQALENLKLYNEYYYVYLDRIIIIYHRDNLSEKSDGYILIKMFNKFGYIEQSKEIILKDNLKKDIYSADDLKLLFKAGKNKNCYYGNYKYDIANKKYKKYLDLQFLMLDPHDIGDYYLGILGWYRYKYLIK